MAEEILSKTERAALADEAAIDAELARAAGIAAAAEGGATGVIGVDHLIDACGADAHKLAGLALLLATAACGFGMMGKKDRTTLEQVRVFQRATDEIAKRIDWELHR